MPKTQEEKRAYAREYQRKRRVEKHDIVLAYQRAYKEKKTGRKFGGPRKRIANLTRREYSLRRYLAIKKDPMRYAEFRAKARAYEKRLYSEPDKYANFHFKKKNRLREYNLKTRVSKLAYMREHREYFREVGKEKRRANEKRRMNSDIIFNIAKKTRKRIRNCITRSHINEMVKHKSVDLLGCSYDFFKAYIESKFTEGMTWDKILNGDIHIDHIRPIASFFIVCPILRAKAFHYSNTQPLWKIENLSKGGSLDRRVSIFEVSNV